VNKLSQKVLKIYEGMSQFTFFEKESLTLSTLTQFDGSRFPGIIKIHESKVIHAPGKRCPLHSKSRTD